MLVAAHVLEVLVMLLGGVVLAHLVRGRRGLPWALFGAGMLAFVFAEVVQLGASNLIASLQADQVLPTPTRDNATHVSFLLIGAFTALSLEPMRWFVLRRYTPGYRSQRSALLVGAGAGAMEAALTGAQVLLMLSLALAFRDEPPEALGAIGLEGREAMKVSLRIMTWWDESPLGPTLAAGEALVRLAFQVGCTCVVMLGLRRAQPAWLALTMVATALFEIACAWAAHPQTGLEPGTAFAVVALGLPLALAMVAGARAAAARDGALEEASVQAATDTGAAAA